jgi:hypothetical protein
MRLMHLLVAHMTQTTLAMLTHRMVAISALGFRQQPVAELVADPRNGEPRSFLVCTATGDIIYALDMIPLISAPADSSR